MPQVLDPDAEVWTTKDGRRMRVEDMDDSHLRNTINWLRRQGPDAKAAQIRSMNATLCFLSGEMAEMCMEQDINSAEEMEPCEFLPDIYTTMLKEACNRGIDTQPDRDDLTYLKEWCGK